VAPFDRSYTRFYSRSVVTMALSCTVFKIKQAFKRTSRFFRTLPAFDAIEGGASDDSLYATTELLVLTCAIVTRERIQVAVKMMAAVSADMGRRGNDMFLNILVS